MSRVAPKQAVEVSASRARCASLVLTWSISRGGAVSCGLVESATGPAVRLEIEVPEPGEHQGAVSGRVLDGERVIPIEGPHRTGRWIEDSIRGVWHLDVDAVLKLTIRQDGNRVEALYARTELLTRAGIAGGRYEFEGASRRA
jgi:hypothetical protein